MVKIPPKTGPRMAVTATSPGEAADEIIIPLCSKNRLFNPGSGVLSMSSVTCGGRVWGLFL